MALTVADVAKHLRYDDGLYDTTDLEHIFKSAEQAVKDHIGAKFDAENYIQQRAILLMCGYFDSFRGVDKDMPSNDGFLPQPVKDLLSPYYCPLVL
ncbi:head-tail connector protein [Acinetobacter sp. ANC 3791]|uniref:head-tail connector protein n=1 Tax=Acinetobacter sp. ANC 3791 TaxID=2529836 RepID=UPI0010403033|nr:head-tail connector protein [Acinetobacter sp. ANC 3791]TCB83336.1 phage gp6-like head-tail connector protein [Acinetobacter sp. ANC 3791]